MPFLPQQVRFFRINPTNISQVLSHTGEHVIGSWFIQLLRCPRRWFALEEEVCQNDDHGTLVKTMRMCRRTTAECRRSVGYEAIGLESTCQPCFHNQTREKGIGYYQEIRLGHVDVIKLGMRLVEPCEGSTSSVAWQIVTG